MLRIDKLLAPECVRRGLPAHSRKRTLDIAADLLSERHPDVAARHLFDALMARERLGSTGIGDGVAIPHCRLECQGMKAALFSLDQPVDYDAPDEQPVDLIFVLVVPVDEANAHLEALSLLAAIFKDADTRRRLREASSSGELDQRFREAAGRQAEASS